MAVTLHVCITCRAGQTVPEGQPTPGARLRDAIVEAGVPDDVKLVPVECLSACSQGCSVALSAPGRWSYVYGRLSEANAADVIAGAAAYPRGMPAITRKYAERFRGFLPVVAGFSVRVFDSVSRQHKEILGCPGLPAP